MTQAFALLTDISSSDSSDVLHRSFKEATELHKKAVENLQSSSEEFLEDSLETVRETGVSVSYLADALHIVSALKPSALFLVQSACEAALHAQQRLHDSSRDPTVLTRYIDKHRMNHAMAAVSDTHDLFVGGGSAFSVDNEPTGTDNTVSVFSSERGRWMALPNMIRNRSRFSLTVLGDSLYALGGVRDADSFAEKYNKHTETWSLLAPISESRGYATYIPRGEHLYVYGGILLSGQNATAVEVYEPHTDSWAYGGELVMTSASHTVDDLDFVRGGVVSYGKNMFFMGSSQNEGVCFRSNTSTDDFVTIPLEVIAPMPFPVSRYSVAAWGNRVYVFGGISSEGFRVKYVQVYDITTNMWSAGCNMPVRNSSTACEVVDNLIYLSGGEVAMQSMHAYNPVTDDWE